MLGDYKTRVFDQSLSQACKIRKKLKERDSYEVRLGCIGISKSNLMGPILIMKVHVHGTWLRTIQETKGCAKIKALNDEKMSQSITISITCISPPKSILQCMISTCSQELLSSSRQPFSSSFFIFAYSPLLYMKTN